MRDRQLIPDRIRRLSRFLAPESCRAAYAGLLLDFNERTTALSPAVRQRFIQLAAELRTHLYPEYDGLETRLARYTGVNKEQILVTNGSSQALDIILRTFWEPRGQVIIPQPSFSVYERLALINRCRIVSLPLRPPRFAFPLSAVLKNIRPDTRVIIVGYPNNPTGTIPSQKAVARLCRAAPHSIVLVDEAYYEFSGRTCVELISRFPNIIITRTFSKAFGLAALRVGYLLASSVHIAELAKVRGPFDVNLVGYLLACAALDDLGSAQSYSREVMRRAKPLVEKFLRRHRIRFAPSAANFILFQPRDAAGLRQRLADIARLRPGPPGWLRLTVGTTEQMRRFIDACAKLLQEER